MSGPDDFDQFYRATVARLTRFVYAYVGENAGTQDLVQDAYARAWQHWGRPRGYDSPEAWLRTVASAYESVTRYAPGQAAAFLAQVRDRVAGCASFEAPGTSGLSGPLHATIVAQGFAGTESLLVCTAAACVPGSYPAFYVAVVRIGDYVLVFDHGFDLGGDPAFGKAAAVRAAGRLTAAVGG